MTSTDLATDPAGLTREELDRLVGGAHHDPHSVLGLHPVRVTSPAAPPPPPAPITSPGSGQDAVDTTIDPTAAQPATVVDPTMAAGSTPAGSTAEAATGAGSTPAGSTAEAATGAGSTAAGSTAAGSTPTGSTPTGSTPTGSTPTGSTPTGSTPEAATGAGSTPTGSTAEATAGAAAGPVAGAAPAPSPPATRAPASEAARDAAAGDAVARDAAAGNATARTGAGGGPAGGTLESGADPETTAILDQGRLVVRTLRPDASRVVAVFGDRRHEMDRIHPGGVFAALVPGPPGDYQLEVTYPGGGGGPDDTLTVDDAYRWLPTLGEIDLHLISEGRHERLWEALGAHMRTYETPHGPVTGTSFAVWAPSARGVRVTGDFDYWQRRAYPMRSLGSSGVWEIFVPGVMPGAKYKFSVLGRDGQWRDKADPLAFAAERTPATASVVHASSHLWGDDEWLARRAATRWHAAPMSIYELHLGSWRQGLGYRDAADQLVDYLVETGFTHIELMAVAEHPYDGSWGYQVTSFYAPTSRFGNPDDFRYLVDRMHQAGIGVIMDWVPGHFPKDEWALARFDGGPLYEHADPRRGEQMDWGTYVFDFGRREVRNFLVANALFWLEEYHVDGLRVDAVASMLYLDYSRSEGQWLPNQFGGRENLDAVSFLQEMNATVYRRVPGAITVAEESTAWPGVTRPTHLGGLGFGFKWNMGWMHDTLDYMSKEPIYRQWHHHQMTFSMMYAFSENFVLPLSHDEVVHGKKSLLGRMPGDHWQQAANLRALFAYMWAHPGKQLLFMGGEFGQGAEWADSRSLDWWLLEDPLHSGLQRLVGDLNTVYRSSPALWTQDTTPAGFSWIDANDAGNNTFSFLRWGDDGSVLACVANFSGGPHEGYRLGLPRAGRWEEVVNTDATVYGGSGVGNMGAVTARPEEWHGQLASATLRVPPLGALWLRYSGPAS